MYKNAIESFFKITNQVYDSQKKDRDSSHSYPSINSFWNIRQATSKNSSLIRTLYKNAETKLPSRIY